MYKTMNCPSNNKNFTHNFNVKEKIGKKVFWKLSNVLKNDINISRCEIWCIIKILAVEVIVLKSLIINSKMAFKVSLQFVQKSAIIR